MAKIDYETKKRMKDKEKALEELSLSLNKFNILLIVIILLTLLSFIFSWATIYNTDIKGSEVSISGLNVLYCSLTKNFTGTDSLSGDMAVPFFYYAETYCKSLASTTSIAFWFLMLSLLISIIIVITKKQSIHIVSIICNVIVIVLLVVCYTKGIAMNNSKIIPIYCKGNPACSIKSYAIFPAIILMIDIVISGFVLMNYFKTKSMFND